jgi:hypothetical protein
MAGKRMPCPECRRIIPVPLPVKNEPKDWRKLDSSGPSGAKKNLEPEPEGAWGSSSLARVSRETLVETGAITLEEDPDAARVRWMRLTMAGILVVLIALAGLGTLSFLNRGKTDRYVAEALTLAGSDSAKLTPEQVAAVHLGAGAYQARTGAPDAAQRANDQMAQARTALGRSTSFERDAMLGELAVAQIQMGGSKADADAGRALDWSEAVKAARQTLEQIRAPEAKSHAVREVVRHLIAQGQVRVAQTMAGRLGGPATASAKSTGGSAESSEIIGIVALELFRSGNQKEARQLAEMALPPEPPKGKEAKPTAAVPSLVALTVLLGLPEPKPRSSGKKGEEKPNEEDVENILFGRAIGLAYKGNLAQARELLTTAKASVRLRGLVALTELGMEASPSETADLNAALELANAEAKNPADSPWVLLRLTQLAAQAGQLDPAQQLAGLIGDPGLKAQAQLAVFRAKLRVNKDKADESLPASVADKTGAAAIAWQEWARHNGRFDKGTLKTVESKDEPIRAAGLVGVALATQDKRK